MLLMLLSATCSVNFDALPDFTKNSEKAVEKLDGISDIMCPGGLPDTMHAKLSIPKVKSTSAKRRGEHGLS